MGFDFVFMIPIVAILSVAGVFVAYSPLGRALAARLGEGQPDERLLQKALEEQTERLTLAEDKIEKLTERFEFTELLLASRPPPPGLSPSTSTPPSTGEAPGS